MNYRLTTDYLLLTSQVSIGYKAAFVPHLQSVGLLAFFEPERLYGQVMARGGVRVRVRARARARARVSVRIRVNVSVNPKTSPYPSAYP